MNIDDHQALLRPEIEASRNRPEFMEAMKGVLADHGLDHVTIFVCPDENDVLLAPLVQESTLPVQFVREFDRNHYVRICPVLPRVNDSIMPYMWHLDHREPHLVYDCADEMKDLLRRYSLIIGALVPLTSVDGTRFIIRYDGDRPPLDPTEFSRMILASIHLFDRFDQIRRTEASAPTSLSTRELEVVRWTAQGKTSVEIGQILSLSDHTVNAYMTNAMRKLDSVNRTQLVAKAIRMKLIN
ncbi:helix-turn-helix transcriptional regulator [Rhizobium halophytocola]|uniref:DNA-binding CsgD family transcriptional regulator n=1 Tax=Rhizobium halophytocola TaxID=735519 RepID=A0ABS4E5W8_9HYPH|nr:LuxR family transcriptional regulator [Rhizobium halophytocola]MBP1853344.1 DNA-binding CsgD family transcriptional regulator [Rhizobium halophytocola]